MIHADDLAQLLILAAERGRRLPPSGDERAIRPGQGYYFAACEQDPTYADLGRLVAQVGRASRAGNSHAPCPWSAWWRPADEAISQRSAGCRCR